MPGTQELTRRIKSIKSTRKVTRAMQMVSASKMRKSQVAALASRAYALQAEKLLRVLHYESTDDAATQDDAEEITPTISGLLQQSPSARRVAVVVVSTNRGLVGSFNANLWYALRELERLHGADAIDYYIVGQKAMDVAVRLGRSVAAHFVKADAPRMDTDVYPMALLLEKGFREGVYSQVCVVYNKFISTLSQKVVTEQLLPLQLQAHEVGGENNSGFLFEPDPVGVLTQLLPKVFESRLYQALLENDAAEHSARMLMMKNATDSAGDIIADLTLTYNQLRQNKITTELSEITAGKIALE